MNGAIPLSSLPVSMACCMHTVCLGHPDYVGGREGVDCRGSGPLKGNCVVYITYDRRYSVQEV